MIVERDVATPRKIGINLEKNLFIFFNFGFAGTFEIAIL